MERVTVNISAPVVIGEQFHTGDSLVMCPKTKQISFLPPVFDWVEMMRTRAVVPFFRSTVAAGFDRINRCLVESVGG
jgi:hypothetical protein